MLSIHLGDYPGSIYDTKTYFRNSYLDSWFEDPMAAQIIKGVNGSELIGSHNIISKQLGSISPLELSGGVKTLLLVRNLPNMIFNASTCGDNCARWLLKINLVTAVLVSSSFLAPVSSAYAVEFSSLSNNEAETSSSSSFSDFVSEDTEKTAEADPCEVTEKTAEADSCNSEVESAAQPAQSYDSSSVDASFQYLYIAQPSLSLGAMQEAAFATASDSDVLTSASLSFVSDSGEQRSIEASAFAGNAAGFTFGQDLLVARYFLTGITYQVKDSNAIYSVDLSSEDYSFNVVN